MRCDKLNVKTIIEFAFLFTAHSLISIESALFQPLTQLQVNKYKLFLHKNFPLGKFPRHVVQDEHKRRVCNNHNIWDARKKKPKKEKKYDRQFKYRFNIMKCLFVDEGSTMFERRWKRGISFLFNCFWLLNHGRDKPNDVLHGNVRVSII